MGWIGLGAVGLRCANPTCFYSSGEGGKPHAGKPWSLLLTHEVDDDGKDCRRLRCANPTISE